MVDFGCHSQITVLQPLMPDLGRQTANINSIFAHYKNWNLYVEYKTKI